LFSFAYKDPNKGNSTTYFVRYPEVFECDPNALDERAEAATEKGDVFGCCMLVDGVKSEAGALIVVTLSRVVDCRHDQFEVHQCFQVAMSYMWCYLPTAWIPNIDSSVAELLDPT
jgi:hypothetical protein